MGQEKSTLFSLITRLYDSQNGKIKLCGFDVKKQNSASTLQTRCRLSADNFRYGFDGDAKFILSQFTSWNGAKIG